MKEATGEANMTIITVVLIGIVSLIGIPLIRGLLNNTSDSGACQAAGCVWRDGDCYTANTGSTKCNIKQLDTSDRTQNNS